MWAMFCSGLYRACLICIIFCLQITVSDTSAFDSEDTTNESNNLVMTVLPPSLLQYKRESEENDVDLDSLKVAISM